MPLQYVKPHPDPHLNVLLYGGPKTGKTVGAASAPKPLLYLNADRPNATRYVHAMYGDDIKEAKIEGLQTLKDATAAVEAGEFASVALDPIADVHRILLEEISGRAIRPKLQEYGDTTVHLERFCRYLCEAPVNAVLVTWEAVARDEESGGFEALPAGGTSNPALAAKLAAMVDVIGYTGVVPQEQGEPRYMAQLVPGRGRRGGNRYVGVLGTNREVNIAEWVKLVKQATAPKAVREEKAA